MLLSRKLPSLVTFSTLSQQIRRKNPISARLRVRGVVKEIVGGGLGGLFLWLLVDSLSNWWRDTMTMTGATCRLIEWPSSERLWSAVNLHRQNTPTCGVFCTPRLFKISQIVHMCMILLFCVLKYFRNFIILVRTYVIIWSDLNAVIHHPSLDEGVSYTFPFIFVLRNSHFIFIISSTFHSFLSPFYILSGNIPALLFTFLII